MKAAKVVLIFFATAALSLSGVFLSMAQDQQIKSTSIQLSRGVPGMLYEPVTPGEKSQIAVYVMHFDSDYLSFSAGAELAGRGYRVLCANNSGGMSQSGRGGGIDDRLIDARAGVEYLRKLPGVRKVVLLGHSGGGTLMSAYQNIAENGLKACQGPEKIARCSDCVSDLLPADGVMLIDSNWSQAAMMLFSLDPAVVDESGGRAINQALNLFNPENGFNANGSTYNSKFITKFLSAAGKRNNQLVKTALERLTAINSGKGKYVDDEPFIVPGAAQGFMNNKLYAQDVRLMSHTQKAWPLVRPDGSIVTQVVKSVRVPANRESFTGSYFQGALITTVRNFLGTYAVRVTGDYGYDEDSVYGIDWSSSYNCPPGNVKGITVPILVMGMTGSWEYLASETIYENAASADKTLAFVEGASHRYNTCKECEEYSGQFGDTQKTTYDYVDKWLSQKGRFIDVAQP